jgi:hypothetical protein
MLRPRTYHWSTLSLMVKGEHALIWITDLYQETLHRICNTDPLLGDRGHPEPKAAPPIWIVGSGRGDRYQPNHTPKFPVCRIHLKVIDHILSSDDCQTPVLWHKDLHLDSIFVDPKKPMGIVGLIDWQNDHVTLLFDQVTHPTFFRQQGTETRKASRRL